MVKNMRFLNGMVKRFEFLNGSTEELSALVKELTQEGKTLAVITKTAEDAQKVYGESYDQFSDGMFRFEKRMGM